MPQIRDPLAPVTVAICGLEYGIELNDKSVNAVSRMKSYSPNQYDQGVGR